MDITSTAGHRLAAARLSGASALVTVVLLCLGSAGCSTGTPRPGAVTAVTTTAAPSAESEPAQGVPPLQPTVGTPAPTTAAPGSVHLPTGANFADPVDVASRFVQSNCAFEWREPYGARERRSAAFLTARTAGTAAPSASGRADWERDVVRRQLSGSCRVSAAQVLDEAPNTPTTRYVDVVAVREIRAGGEAVKRDQAEYTYVLVRSRGRWLVDGTTAGG